MDICSGRELDFCYIHALNTEFFSSGHQLFLPVVLSFFQFSPAPLVGKTEFYVIFYFHVVPNSDHALENGHAVI